MGWVKKIETEAGILGVWELNDSLDELQSNFHFSIPEKVIFDKINVEKRKKEFLAVRLLTEQLLHIKPEIAYDSFGRPKIKNNPLNISISHSDELVVVFLSNKKIGIDVEIINRDIEKIAPRFLSADELEYIKKLEDTRSILVLFWSIKEAIFKCSGLQEIHFNRDIIIHTEKMNEKKSYFAELHKKNNKYFFRCRRIIFKNNIIVYCVEEEKI